MTEATTKSVSAIRVGPELPDFHKLSSDDDITCYLATFERMATAAKKPKAEWPRLLEPYLTGKAQKAFYALHEEDKGVYSKIVDIILRHYQLTPDAYRLKFRTASKKPDETFEEFVTRLELYFQRWLKPSDESGTSEDVKRMMELLLTDQFLTSVRNENLRTKLREKKLSTVQAVARYADEYVLNRKMEESLNNPYKSSQTSHSRPLETRTPTSPKTDENFYNARLQFQKGNTQTSHHAQKRHGTFETICYRCHQLGHRVADCPYPPPVKPDSKNVRQEDKPPRPPSASAKPTEGPKVNFLKVQASCESPDTGTYIMVQLNGSDVKALMDTGSAVSLVRESLCESIGLPVTPEPTPQPFTMVNGTKFYTTGLVETKVEVAGIQVPVSLHQTGSLPTPVLLGRDFASHAKLVIDFNQNSFWVDTGADEPCIKWPLLGLPPPPSCDHHNDPVLSQIDPPSNEVSPLADPVFNSDDYLQLEHVLSEFPEVLADKPGRTSLYTHRIETGDTPPVRGPVYRLSPERKQSLRTQLDDGRIEPSCSPWASPVVMVPKAEKGEYRLCVDYRNLNRHTKIDAYPMPTIDSILESLHGSTIFSSLDLKSGYHQMYVAPEDVEKTAFKCEEGLFQFRVLPFGVINGPASFQRLMETVLHDVIGKTCYVYLDDIVCFSPSVSEHFEDLRVILQKLREVGLTVNRKKCFFGCSKLKYLGHIIGKDGLQTDPAKVQTILEYPTPQNVKQLERFLGMVTWYAKFIPKLTDIASPLNHLRHKSVKWDWTEECDSSFKRLQTVLTSEPILAYPDPSHPFAVHTDASNTGLGAVLLQEKDGDMYTIAYASRSLNPPERNYSTTEKECLAVIWALEKWRIYLEGQRCTVVTDHQALTWLFRKARLTGRLARWVLRLQDFCFDITYRPGPLHVVPDALSRTHEDITVGVLWEEIVDNNIDTPSDANFTMHEEVQDDNACAATVCRNPDRDIVNWIQCDTCMSWYHQLCVHVTQRRAAVMPTYTCPKCRKKRWQNQMDMQWRMTSTSNKTNEPPPLLDLHQLKMEQANDPALANLITTQPVGYRVVDDILYHYTGIKWKAVVPKPLRQMVLQLCHSQPTSGHLGRVKTLDRLDSLCLWWSGISRDVRDFVRACKQCRATKPVFRKPPGLMLSTTSDKPWEIVGIDLMGPFPRSYGDHEYLLVAVDHFSKWTEVFPMRKATGKEVASVVVRQLFCRFGAPKKLLSDNGPQFISKAMEAVCADWGVERVFITPYHPQTNWVERVNRNLKGMMRSYLTDDHRQWDVHVSEFAFALNSVTHSTTGKAPCVVMFGRQLQSPLSNHWKLDISEELDDPETVQETVRHNMRKTSQKRKQNYDKRRRHAMLHTGDQVMFRTHPQSNAGKHFAAKLAPKWCGPFTVIERLTPVNYKLVSNSPPIKDVIAHVDQLKPC